MQVTVGDPKRANDPMRQPRASTSDSPSRPLDNAWAADLLDDLTQSDLAITEFEPPEPVNPSLHSEESTNLDPILVEAFTRDVGESTLIDRLPKPVIPPATTLVDPPGAGPPFDGALSPKIAPTTSSERQARGLLPLPMARVTGPAQRNSRDGPRPKLSLPCNVLIIDDDRRAGAQTGARLMEVGCSCRAVTVEESAEVLDHTFHVVLLEVPAQEAHTDGGQARIARIAPWKGTLVLTSAAVIDPIPEAAGVSVTKPYLIEDLITAIEVARRKLPLRAESRTVEILDPIEVIAPHDLDVNVVRAMFIRAEGQASRGRVRTMSYDGEILVLMNQPPRNGIEVGVELTLADGRRMEIGGKISQSSSTEMEISLRLDEDERTFIRHFLDQARDPSQPFVEQVRIRQAVPMATGSVNDASLDRMWLEAAGKLDDNDLHQRFIQACLKAQKLEHAIKCYRQLKQEKPNDERVAKYLQQVGTILGFYALKKEPAVKDEAKLPMAVKIAMGLFLAAALILWIMLVVMR